MRFLDIPFQGNFFKKHVHTFFVAMAMCLVMVATATARDKLTPLGQDITIWFDTGGPYNTIVQNGAMQAASDLGADVIAFSRHSHRH